MTSDITLNPPDRFVSTPGESATFVCLSPGIRIVSLQWLVNGSLVENLNLTNVRTEFDNISGVLRFDDIPEEYNMSRIRCMAIAEGNSEPLLSQNSSLILQGSATYVVGVYIYWCNDSIGQMHRASIWLTKTQSQSM